MEMSFTPDAATRIGQLTTDAYTRIAKLQTDLANSLGCERGATDEELKALYAAECEVWRNLAVTFAAWMGLRGMVALEDERNFICRNEWITYGVNQGRDGSWSINS